MMDVAYLFMPTLVDTAGNVYHRYCAHPGWLYPEGRKMHLIYKRAEHFDSHGFGIAGCPFVLTYCKCGCICRCVDPVPLQRNLSGGLQPLERGVWA